MQRRALLLLAALALPAWAQTRPELAGLQRRGSGTMRFFGLRVYDIHLWSAQPIDAERWREQDLALEIEYARHLVGREIAKRSLQEMRRQAEIPEADAATWLAEMNAAFPDVNEGDRITGRYEAGRGVSFHVNGQLRRRIEDARFAQLFFGIWLSPQTSEPRLRQALLAPHASR